MQYEIYIYIYIIRSYRDGVGSGLQVSTDLDHDRKLHNTLVVRFPSSWDEGSQCVGITRTLIGFPQLKNLLKNNKEIGNMW